jgi:nucleotide-binding universal stress UspA family protein
MLILHAAVDSRPDDPAFLHAVALALQGGGSIRTVHIADGVAPEPPLPSASVLLRRWGHEQRDIAHERLTVSGFDEVGDGLLSAIEAARPSLVVLDTHARRGVLRVLGGSIAESVARNSPVPVLLLPESARGLVDADTGALRLERAVIAAGAPHDAQLGLDALALLAKISGNAPVEAVLVHADDGSPAPWPRVPPGLSSRTQLATGTIEDAIVKAAHDGDASLVVMTSHGHDGLADVLLSSHTERVLHAIRCPLLWVPATWRA